MLVIVEDDVFAKSTSLELTELFAHGRKGRHAIVVESDDGPYFSAWLNVQSVDFQDELQFVLDSSKRELAPRDKRAIRIAGVSTSDWSVSPPVISLSAALSFLARPVSVLVENKINDGAFVRAFLSEDRRNALVQAERDFRIQVEHGGGLQEMIKEVRALREQPERRLNTFVIFDSDALCPGAPSDPSNQLRNECSSAGLPVLHHQLERRARENYLPKQALGAWHARLGSNDRREKQPIVNSFCRLTDAQRHHYHMKSGFSRTRDKVYLNDSGGIFTSLVRAQQRALESGFGEKVGDLFLEVHFKLDPDWFRRDGQWPESTHLYESLMSLL